MAKGRMSVEKVKKGLQIFIPDRQLPELKDQLISIGLSSKMLKDCNAQEELIKRVIMELDASDVMSPTEEVIKVYEKDLG